MTQPSVHPLQADALQQPRQAGERGRLRIVCPDGPGIVAAVSDFLFRQGANIVQSDQYTTHPEAGLFFMRVEFDLPNLDSRFSELQHRFAEIRQRFDMQAEFTQAAVKKRMVIFVSKELHCLQELMWLWQTGELHTDITAIVSNHRDAEALATAYNVPFFHTPVTPETKALVEQKQLEIVDAYADVIVLARYMQILSPRFVHHRPNQIINIHHSFLPAFIGRNPYQQAYQRGVKLIGATAHYVTEDLDEGPIIEQDVQRVDHRFDAADLKRIGRHIERVVLARAVKWHLEDRILVHDNKTIVFS
ncbi:formyltetrahydrofolate deformylase [Alicyclobacillus contaminans]|uniref:formyltetrahydrofolate deformylase n=1 Tax=Alicyclobacillus contaminans TaxID=392016 RepID=UPI0004284F1D|nr:formyltetrahydrofolate deformylase [Alicyclobacillus contaminans]GMA51459.1 formyltetrahydrofolate deformylase [Alicyclobacillus contaminans]